VFSIQAKSGSDAIPLSPASNDPFLASLQPTPANNKGFTLKQPPKWMRRPVGACFSFGNRLSIFAEPKEETCGRRVSIRQVTTEPDLVDRCNKLDQAVASNDFLQFCQTKLEQYVGNDREAVTWNFLRQIVDKVTFFLDRLQLNLLIIILIFYEKIFQY
jgi:protein transport protein SEC31